MQRYRRKASWRGTLVASLLCALVAPVVAANADDIQLIRLHSQSLFVPKSWMTRGNIIALQETDGGSAKGAWSQPQEEPIDATTLIFHRPDQNSVIPQALTYPLPSLIYFTSYHDTGVDFSRMLPETKRWLDFAASQPADAAGFVRVWEGFAEPGQQPQSEKFVYKGYLSKAGQPLIILSENVKTPRGNHYPSRVDIAVEHDLGLHYRFSNEEFPENRWWDLYKHTLAFLTYLQMPK